MSFVWERVLPSAQRRKGKMNKKVAEIIGDYQREIKPLWEAYCTALERKGRTIDGDLYDVFRMAIQPALQRAIERVRALKAAEKLN